MCNLYPIEIRPVPLENFGADSSEYDRTVMTRAEATLALGEKMMAGFCGGQVPGVTFKEQP